MNEAVLSLGSNLGRREENIKKAILAIGNIPDTKVIKASHIYETEPFGVPEKQSKYLNCCVWIKTLLPAEILLGSALGIESAMGRRRPYKNAPRVIDIDLLLYGGMNIEGDHIKVPHPRMDERAFVMIPLKELFNGMIAIGYDFSKAFSRVNKVGVSLYKKEGK